MELEFNSMQSAFTMRWWQWRNISAGNY